MCFYKFSFSFNWIHISQDINLYLSNHFILCILQELLKLILFNYSSWLLILKLFILMHYVRMYVDKFMFISVNRNFKISNVCGLYISLSTRSKGFTPQKIFYISIPMKTWVAPNFKLKYTYVYRCIEKCVVTKWRGCLSAYIGSMLK